MTEKDKEIQTLRVENKELRNRIDRYVREFRVCRFCANIHKDCSPKDSSCEPRWGGL